MRSNRKRRRLRSAIMSPRFLQACQSLQSAEKACWDILLREQPDAEMFPDDLVSVAMDKTLDQLWSLLRSGPARKRLHEVSTQPPLLPSGKECALTTHLPYFNAGERALELIAGEVARLEPALAGPKFAGAREELIAAFNVLVQCQLEVICSSCDLSGECRYGDLRAMAGLPHQPVRSPVAGTPAKKAKVAHQRKSRSPARTALSRRNRSGK